MGAPFLSLQRQGPGPSCTVLYRADCCRFVQPKRRTFSVQQLLRFIAVIILIAVEHTAAGAGKAVPWASSTQAPMSKQYQSSSAAGSSVSAGRPGAWDAEDAGDLLQTERVSIITSAGVSVRCLFHCISSLTVHSADCIRKHQYAAATAGI